ncbi:unnamed protein product [Nesidiocoris tenuis]|uniref:TATA box-binding protein-associated factor RNA polymerase I subunit B n=1 Tax=Nesidiocoris tenuis TaxID=355587 RepID=A0A6H5GH71_9HEMI|nr:unnamed protein product [Nesidiocoris tenuis]
MSQKIECQQCGSSDYRLESGFYFCAECHMQSQDVREQLMEQYGAGASLYKVTGWKQPRSEPGTSAAKQPETDREENCIVHGVKALMRMKPPKQKFDAHLDHEGLAMALILFALKVLIGLDDFTEYNYVPRENDEGVVWEQWCHQYLNQTSMNNPKHYTALRRLCPKHIPGQERDLSQPNPETFGKLKNRETNLNNLRSAMKAVLQKYVTKVPEDKQKSDSRPVVLRKLAVLGASDRSTFQYEVAAAEVLPTSFHWLLCELANAICQSPIRIYTNLVRVEKCSGRALPSSRRRGNWSEQVQSHDQSVAPIARHLYEQLLELTSSIHNIGRTMLLKGVTIAIFDRSPKAIISASHSAALEVELLSDDLCPNHPDTGKIFGIVTYKVHRSAQRFSEEEQFLIFPDERWKFRTVASQREVIAWGFPLREHCLTIVRSQETGFAKIVYTSVCCARVTVEVVHLKLD